MVWVLRGEKIMHQEVVHWEGRLEKPYEEKEVQVRRSSRSKKAVRVRRSRPAHIFHHIAKVTKAPGWLQRIILDITAGWEMKNTTADR